jgi:dolichol-phosphate mannosyltransferase
VAIVTFTGSEFKKKLISICIPVLNEEENILPLYDAVDTITKDMADKYEFEFIFTDNHSTDNTFKKLKDLAATDHRVRAFRFSRNFGYQRSILTAYIKAKGEAVVQLDGDLQDPPDMIPKFIALWEKGYDVIYGVRKSRQENWVLTSVRKGFYRILNWLSEDELPLDAGDFRLIDRKIVNLLRKIEDSTPYIRGEIASLGFNQIGVPYDRKARLSGRTKFCWSDLMSLALDGVLNHSIAPLRISSYIGLVVTVASLVLMIGYMIIKLFFDVKWPPGFTTTTVLILLLLGLNALFLGIIGEYVGRIYKQVKKKPLTIIENVIDNNEGEENQEALHELP